jgi:DHA1 family bicyclomycin/chloramphenicol resistance-like MFS transporter
MVGLTHTKQKFLGSKGLIVLIAFLSAFVPLSIDLYLPALPGMSDYFGVPSDQINLTLTAFFIFYALGALVWGPLSDRYGRKPVLVVGLGLYVVASVFCALMWDVRGLVVCRVFQAIGASAAGAVATAIVKDVYSGSKRESVLAIVQSMVLIAPAAAPVLGAFLLSLMSWRGIFWTLAGIGVVGWVGSLLFEETIPERTTGMVPVPFNINNGTGIILHSILRLGHVLKNRGFTLLLVLFSFAMISGMAYVASSTYIYQDGFHLSQQGFSLFFSLNALGSIAGPVIYMRLSGRVHPETVISTCFAVVAVSGLLVCFLGNVGPWIFALCILPTSIANNLSRPPSANMMLEQQKGDTGAVSSLMGFTGTLMGSLGMQLISLPWGNTILALGIITFAAGAVSLLVWPFVLGHVIRLPGPGALPMQSSDPPDVMQ